MANQWLRLWHELPNDPKWRTIARASGEPIPSVIAVYLHLIVSASMNVTRGTINVIPEDIASALDIGTDSVTHIMDAIRRDEKIQYTDSFVRLTAGPIGQLISGQE